MKTLPTVDYNRPSTIETSYDYRQAVLSMTDSVIEQINYKLESGDLELDKSEIEDFVNDSALHEIIDGSEFVIYNHHNLNVIKFSDNDEYAIDNFGSEWAGSTLKEGGLSGLHNGIAFWALYADVQECLNDHLEELELTDFFEECDEE